MGVKTSPDVRGEETIFLHALALPVEERPAFLREMCGDDSETRAQIEGLLRGHDAAVFMKVPAAPARENGPMDSAAVPGARIGGYRLREKLGSGGFGTVWAAEQKRPLRREVALKILKPGLDTGEVIARFEQERQTLALLGHPHIARIFDAGATELGRPFFAMELVRGKKITGFCEDARLGLRERLALFVEVCRAVQHAHQKGVIHRDIKPSNVLVEMHGGGPVPKVIDFGIAKAMQRAPGITITLDEKVVGTPAYMSPEQARPDRQGVDTRSDVYALGALLYELLTGCTVFDAEVALERGVEEVRRMICEVDPPRPSTRASALVPGEASTVFRFRHARPFSSDLDWIVMKALEKDRERRYASADDFAEDIERYLADEPVVAAAPGAAYRLGKFLRRHRMAATAIAAIVLAIFVATFLVAREALRARKAEAVAGNQLRAMSRSDQAIADTHLQNRETDMAIAYLSRAIQNDPHNTVAQELLLSTLVHGEGLRDPLPRLVLKHDGPVRAVSFSPDGTRIVTASDDRTARIWNSATGAQIGAPLRHEGAVESASFDTENARVVTASRDGTVRVWNTASGGQIGAPLVHPGPVTRAMFNREDTHLLTLSGDTAYVWEVATLRLCHRVQHADGAVLHAATFSLDGTKISTACDDGTVRIIATASGDETPRLTRLGARVLDVGFNFDGREIVTASGFGAQIWKLDHPQTPAADLKHDTTVRRALFSPDGTRLLTIAANTAHLWQRSDAKAFGDSMSHDGAISGGTFSTDGTRVVTFGEDRTARLWDASKGRPIAAPLRHDSAVLAAAFSPDGQRVVTACLDSTARIWNAASGAPMGPPLPHGAPVMSACFDREGLRVLTASGDTAQLWDAVTCLPIGAPLKHGGKMTSACFSPDGTRVVTCGENAAARLWQIQPVARQSPFPADVAVAVESSFGPFHHAAAVCAAEFSPDGAHFATASADKTARLWNVATGQQIGPPLPHEHIVRGVAFSPDGRLLATADEGGSARIWNAITGQPIGEPLRHDTALCTVRFHPDGRRVVISCRDNTARIWDITTGLPVSTLFRHESDVIDAAFSPDGTRIAAAGAAGGPGIALFWDADCGKTFDPAILEKLVGATFAFTFEDGTLKLVPTAQRLPMRDALATFTAADPSTQRTIRWLLTPVSQRTVSPLSATTPRAIADRAIASGDRHGLRGVLFSDPGHPLLPLALARFEKRAERALYLRDYALVHLPPDPKLWQRAAEMLLDRQQLALAVRALDRLAALDPAAATQLAPRLSALKARPPRPRSFNEMKKFSLRFDDPNEPLHSWVRQGNEWVEVHTHGRNGHFVITGPWEVEGRPGTLLHNRDSLEHLIFISDPDVPDPILLQRGSGALWDYLAQMIEME